MATTNFNDDAKLPFLTISEMRPTGQTASATAISLLIVASLTVGLRYFTRISRNYPLDQGDFWLMVSLCLFGGYCFVLIRGLQTSGGTLANNEFTPYGVYNFYKYLYAIEIVFTATITAAKLSLLLLYTTIFSTPKLVRTARMVMGLCVVWLIVFMFTLVFQCRPIRAFWDLSLLASGQGKCIPFGQILVAFEVTNMVIDVVILSIPVFVIKSLQLPRSRKLACACLFLLGGLILVVCICRTYYLANITNSTATNIFSHGLNWSSAELAAGIMCASIPTYGPYFNKIGKIGRIYSELSPKLSFRSWRSKLWSKPKSLDASSDSFALYTEKDSKKSDLIPRENVLHLSDFPQTKTQARADDPSHSISSEISAC